MSNSFLKPVENLFDEGLVYVDEQVDNIKLRTVKILSEGTTAVTGLLLVFSILSVLLLALSFAFVLWLGEMLDSYAAAAFIVAGVLLVILIVIMLLRKKLFKNTFVDMYNSIMNPKQKETTLEALDKAIEKSSESIQTQEERLKTRVVLLQEYYKPRHLLNEGLRRAGLYSSKNGFSVGKAIASTFRALTGNSKNVKKLPQK